MVPKKVLRISTNNAYVFTDTVSLGREVGFSLQVRYSDIISCGLELAALAWRSECTGGKVVFWGDGSRVPNASLQAIPGPSDFSLRFVVPAVTQEALVQPQVQPAHTAQEAMTVTSKFTAASANL
jgi:hypothetical protein